MQIHGAVLNPGFFERIILSGSIIQALQKPIGLKILGLGPSNYSVTAALLSMLVLKPLYGKGNISKNQQKSSKTSVGQTIE